MKAIFSVFVILIGINISNSQNDISIKLLEKPSNALSDSDHYYLIDLKNNSSKQFENLNISVKSVSCNFDSRKNNFYKDQYSARSLYSAQTDQARNSSNLNINLLRKDKTTAIQNLNLNGNSTTVFYIKCSINNNTKLNTANCFEIVVKSSDNEIELSNQLIIEQLIPDPKDFD